MLSIMCLTTKQYHCIYSEEESGTGTNTGTKIGDVTGEEAVSDLSRSSRSEITLDCSGSSLNILVPPRSICTC